MEERELIDNLVEQSIEKRTIELKQRTYEELQEENERLSLELSGYRAAILNDDKLLGLQQRINKALDKLYCYGEVFDSKILQQFQKEMEDILQGE